MIRRYLVLLVSLCLLAVPVLAIVEDSYTVSRIHFDGNFEDDSGKVWVSYNGTQINGTAYKFGIGAGQFNETNRTSLKTATSTDFDFSSGDFTVEFWYREQKSVAYGMVFTTNDAGSYAPVSIYDDAGTMKVYASSSLTGWDVLNGVSLGTANTTGFSHYALSREGTIYRGFKDGTLISYTGIATPISSGDGQVSIGARHNDGFLVGLIDEFRVSKGIARYTTSFTPSTTQFGSTWIFAMPGQFNWTCPAGVTNISLDITGAGGGGHGGNTTGAYSWAGAGGYAGEHEEVSIIPVTPTTNYTIVIGYPGANATYGTVANSGTNSSAFGYNKNGGAGGGILTGITPGGDGEIGVFSTLKYAFDGDSQPPYGTGGTAGTGYGAGGGGGSADNVDYNTKGGSGSSGYVRVIDYEYAGLNTPEFSAVPTTTSVGNIIVFTDQSTIRDTTNLTYNWSFGDGGYSSTAGTVNHVYGLYGIYTVNLTISSDSGTVTESKSNYITIAQTTYPTTYYTQKTVRIKVVDAYGTPLEGATISVNYIASSLPSTDISWLTSAFGINPTVAQQMVNSELAMQATSGSDGAASFMMFSAIQYGITITNATAGLSKYTTLYPQDSDYVIYCTLTSQGRVTDRTTYLYNSSLYVSEPNSSWITWNLLYQDTSGDTTSLTWNITCWNNMTVMYTNTWPTPGTGVITDSYTFPSEPRGMEYRAMYDATRDI